VFPKIAERGIARRQIEVYRMFGSDTGGAPGRG
jgi:hypothetical protein